MSVPLHTDDTYPNRRRSPPWTMFATLLGTVVTVAGLVYAIGALTMWLRMDLMGFNPDSAIEHMSPTILVALGVRTLVTVSAIAASVLGLVYFARWRFKAVSPRNWRKIMEPRSLWGAAVLLGLGTVAAGFENWLLFGICSGATIAVATTAVFVRHGHGTRRHVPVTLTLTLVALYAALISITYQIGEDRFYLDGVTLSNSPVPTVPDGVVLPYLGIADGRVFVPEVTKISRTGNYTQTSFQGTILSIPLGSQQIRYPQHPLTMKYQSGKPLPVLLGRLRDAVLQVL